MGKGDNDTTTQDNRQDRSLGLQDVNDTQLYQLSGDNNQTVFNSVDSEVLRTSLDAVSNLSGENYQFAASQTDRALEYGAGATNLAVETVIDAGNAVLKNTQDTLLYGAGVTDKAIDAVYEAGGAVIKVTDNALIYGAGATNRAIDTVLAAGDAVITSERKSREDTQIFAAGAIQETNRANAAALLSVSEANSSALEKSLSFGGQAFGAATNSFAEASRSVDKSVDRAYEFTSGAFMTAIDAVLDSTNRATDKVTNAATETINVVSKASTSENQQSLDKVIKLAGVVMAGIAAVAVLPRFIK